MILKAKRLKYLRQALGLVWESARGWTVLQAGITVVLGALPVASLFLTKRLVDAVGGYLAAEAGGRDPVPLLVLVPWVVLVAATGKLCQAISSLVGAAQSEAVAIHVQDTIQAKSIEADLASFETPSYHNRIRMAQIEAASRPTSIIRNLTQLGTGGFALLSIAGVVLYEQGLLLPVLLIAAIPGALARIRNSRLSNRLRVQQSEPERYSFYLNLLLTGLPFAKEVRLFGIGAELRKRYQALRGRLRQTRLQLAWQSARNNLLADLVSALAMAVGLVMIYFRMRSGNMSIGGLALLYGGLQRGKSAFGGVLGSLASLYEDSLFIGHYYDFLAMPETVRSPAVAKPMPPAIKQGLTLENVSFRYPETSRDVLKNVSLMIAAGSHLALVGENGSGKTTLLKLLCRFYDPTAGRILLDGTDLREFDPAVLRRRYAALFQDFVRYQMTAAENIRMGDISLAADDPAIEQAAHQAGAEAILAGLPLGLETPLGRMFTDGAELSEGQWQRVALARVLLRKAPIALLDEPTSMLDARAERELLVAFVDALKDRTAIVVSHRLTTVQSADRIVMLADGRLVEDGTHTGLLAREGAYASLFATHSVAGGRQHRERL